MTVRECAASLVPAHAFPLLPSSPFLHLRRRGRLALELGDAVAQLGGALELQVRGGRQHLAVQLFQVFLGDVILLAGHLGDHLPGGDFLLDAARRSPLRTVSGVMPCSALYSSCSSRRRCGLVDGPLHRVGHLVGIEDHLGVDVAGRPADRLHQRRFAAQEAFLVGVEDRHQRHFRQVEPFAQQVDADQHVETRPRAARAGSPRARWRPARECSHLQRRPASRK